MRINRHNTVRTLIAGSLRKQQEVGCLSINGSTRRADIVVIDRTKYTGMVIDPTVRFEESEQQPRLVCEEKKAMH